MATYAVGDIQGCFGTFRRLLDRIAFEPSRDRLLLVGDLVNRGPQSVEMLRWVMRNERSVRVVLGNHDLYLISRALGAARKKKRDTLDPVLEARDCDEMIEWLRTRPLVYRENGTLLVHAGLLPSWSADDAVRLAGELEAALQGDDAPDLLETLRDPPGRPWVEKMRGLERLRTLVQIFTQLRTCTHDGVPCLEFSGKPADAPPGCRPWFETPSAREKEVTVVFGHWAALGLYVGPRVIGLDTGGVWGNKLTAIRLKDRMVFQEPAR
jgi:bis(5'-nucleosyl)-tetraphosphatase (symmetrical)